MHNSSESTEADIVGVFLDVVVELYVVTERHGELSDASV